MSLTSPLGLIRHVRRADLRLEAVPWLNVLLLGWMFTLLGSRFIYAPGLVVAVGGADNLPPKQLNLPGGGALPGTLPDATLTIITAKKNQFIFKDGIYDRDSLRAGFEKLRQAQRETGAQPRVLLVKAEKDVTFDTIAEVNAQAKAAGFANVVWAQQVAPGAAR